MSLLFDLWVYSKVFWHIFPNSWEYLSNLYTPITRSYLH